MLAQLRRVSRPATKIIKNGQVQFGSGAHTNFLLIQQPGVQVATRKMSSQSNEENLAQTAKPVVETIFDKIVKREIPANIAYEDDKCLAFHDINPQAPKHLLVIPKVRGNLSRLSKAEEEDTAMLGHLLYASKIIAEQQGLAETGYRIVINDGPHGCQSVYHIHVHILGGRQMRWPPG